MAENLGVKETAPGDVRSGVRSCGICNKSPVWWGMEENGVRPQTGPGIQLNRCGHLQRFPA